MIATSKVLKLVNRQPDSTTYGRTDCWLQDRGGNTSIAYRRFDTLEVVTAYVVDVNGVEMPG